MGYEDYQKGQQNPWGIGDVTKPGGWDYQQGQFDAAKKAMNPALPPPPTNSPATAIYTGPARPPLPQPKGLIRGILLTAVFGPLGLFYASKKGALLMLLALLAVTTFVNLQFISSKDPSLLLREMEGLRALWPVSVVFSVIWSVIAIGAYNRKVRRAVQAAINPV